MPRVVIDTNILISALFWEGVPRSVYQLAKAGEITMLLTKKMEEELSRVLQYPKFGLTQNEIKPILRDIHRIAVVIESNSHVELIIEDPTDNIFLECAIDGAADYIISGDSHLLDLKHVKSIKIVKPREFLEKWST